MSSPRQYRVIVSDVAREELDAAVAYIEIDSPMNAERLLVRVLSSMEGLAAFPRAHPIAPDSLEVEGEIRHITESPLRIIYEVREQLVFVHHVRHAKRQPIGKPDSSEV